VLATQSVIPPAVSIRETMMHAAEAAGWTEQGKPAPEGEVSEQLLRGIGVASGYKNVCYSFGFPDKCTAKCELYGDQASEKAII
ncbi:MAG: hypothetical protein GWN58_45675, partial [Anaerolineae bacterium]|nr:hypothetical protein [Anaerolineae bacterium]